jgi:hypothetical protein
MICSDIKRCSSQKRTIFIAYVHAPEEQENGQPAMEL